MKTITKLIVIFFISLASGWGFAETKSEPQVNPPAAVNNSQDKPITTTTTNMPQPAKLQPPTVAPQSVAAASPKPIASENMTSKLPDPVGRVVWIKGKFTAVMPNKEKRELQKASLIYLKDTLYTDDKTQAQIVFTDNTLMTFRPDTQFYINQYVYKPQKKSKSVGKYIMDLVEGGFRTVTGLISKNNPDDYQINTPVATTGVRGTDYSVFVSKKGELFIGFAQGVPCVENKKKKVCLDKENPYAEVKSKDSVPVPLSQQPYELKDQLLITPAVIAPFTGGGSGGGGSSICIGT